jgi:uncharacterized protein YndB with AHSA1/START domain
MTMTTKEAEITPGADVPTITITREFDAPPAKVFRAHVEPDLFVQWIGPGERATTLEHFDCRTGGAFRYTITGDEGFETSFFGSFHEVRESELIVQTFTWVGEPDGVALETLRFEDLDGGRCRLTAMSLCDDFEARDAWLASGMEVGVNEGYAKLDELVATM